MGDHSNLERDDASSSRQNGAYQGHFDRRRLAQPSRLARAVSSQLSAIAAVAGMGSDSVL